MDERRKCKNAKDELGKTQYESFRKDVQRRCRKTLNNWIEGKCKKSETRFRIGKVDAAHREIRGNFGKRLVNANLQ